MKSLEPYPRLTSSCGGWQLKTEEDMVAVSFSRDPLFFLHDGDDKRKSNGVGASAKPWQRGNSAMNTYTRFEFLLSNDSRLKGTEESP